MSASRVKVRMVSHISLETYVALMSIKNASLIILLGKSQALSSQTTPTEMQALQWHGYCHVNNE